MSLMFSSVFSSVGSESNEILLVIEWPGAANGRTVVAGFFFFTGRYWVLHFVLPGRAFGWTTIDRSQPTDDPVNWITCPRHGARPGVAVNLRRRARFRFSARVVGFRVSSSFFGRPQIGHFRFRSKPSSFFFSSSCFFLCLFVFFYPDTSSSWLVFFLCQDVFVAIKVSSFSTASPFVLCWKIPNFRYDSLNARYRFRVVHFGVRAVEFFPIGRPFASIFLSFFVVVVVVVRAECCLISSSFFIYIYPPLLLSPSFARRPAQINSDAPSEAAEINIFFRTHRYRVSYRVVSSFFSIFHPAHRSASAIKAGGKKKASRRLPTRRRRRRIAGRSPAFRPPFFITGFEVPSFAARHGNYRSVGVLATCRQGDGDQ